MLLFMVMGNMGNMSWIAGADSNGHLQKWVL